MGTSTGSYNVMKFLRNFLFFLTQNVYWYQGLSNDPSANQLLQKMFLYVFILNHHHLNIIVSFLNQGEIVGKTTDIGVSFFTSSCAI